MPLFRLREAIEGAGVGTVVYVIVTDPTAVFTGRDLVVDLVHRGLDKDVVGH